MGRMGAGAESSVAALAMPTAAPRPCLHPSCPELVPKGYCVKHASQREQERGSSSARGYDGAWRVLRERFLLTPCECRDSDLGPPGPSAACPLCHGTGLAHGFCEECLDAGYLERAAEVDHVIPWRQRPSLRLNPLDLQSLCDQHHNLKSMVEQHGGDLSPFQLKQRTRVLTSLGLDL